MFDAPVDALYVWSAVAAVSAATLGVVVGLPATAPPDASAMAATVDEVATSPAGSVSSRPVAAVEWRLRNGQVGLRSSSGTAHAALLGQATPAVGKGLGAVLDGRDPRSVFGSRVAFRRAAAAARDDATGWRSAPDRLTVRRVTWGGVDVTLVG